MNAPGRERWLEAGQDLLRSGGAGAVKLARLTAASGLTTGSFYHHFSGMAEYLDELARYFGREQTEANLERLAAEPARARLDGLVRLADDRRMRPLHAAMRDWAGSNPVAAEAVAATDALLFAFVVDAFVELGHPVGDARIRATLLLSVGTARLEPPWPLPRDASSRILDILTDAR